MPEPLNLVGKSADNVHRAYRAYCETAAPGRVEVTLTMQQIVSLVSTIQDELLIRYELRRKS